MKKKGEGKIGGSDKRERFRFYTIKCFFHFEIPFKFMYEFFISNFDLSGSYGGGQNLLERRFRHLQELLHRGFG